MIQLGLIGFPLDHSLSPKIHKVALESCELQGDYSLFPIASKDEEGLMNLLARVRVGEIAGLNVTIPHKQNVIPMLDELTPTAQAIGAVNTISMQNGKLTGDNTDAPGFLADLNRFIGNWEVETEIRKEVIDCQKGALVLGAGGSARAVVYALAKNGWIVSLASRRLEQARAFIAQFPDPNSQISITEYHSSAFRSLYLTISLLVNTTPLGMVPDTSSSPWTEDLPFPPNAAVYDLVYNPRETKLVRDARAVGLPATTGLGMLIEQAALAFEIWTGRTPPREALWNALTTDHQLQNAGD